MRALLVYFLSKLHVPYDGNNIELLNNANTANTDIECTDTIYSELTTYKTLGF